MVDSILKTCPKCGATEGFGRNKARKDGLSVYCLKCANEYGKAYYDMHFSKHQLPGDRPAYLRRRNQEHKKLINPFRTKPCVDCGKSFPAPCMEFDHVHGEKRHSISEMSSWKHATVLAEIAKCEAVCANCHRVRTALRRPPSKMPDANLPAWKFNKAMHQFEKIATFRSEIAALKSCTCHDCEKSFHPAAMDFDHVRGAKLFSISNGWSYTRLEVQEEIAKCDLICANCHRLRTEKRAGRLAA